MRHLPMLVLVLAGCGGGDPWVGDYEGTLTTSAITCDGAETTDGSIDATLTLDRDTMGGLFMADACLVSLRELSDTTAQIEASECDTALPSGTPVHYTWTGGTFVLRGDELDASFTARAETATGCANVTSRFLGLRAP